MTNTVLFWRKDDPATVFETLVKAAPIMREHGVMWRDIIAALQPMLEKNGIKIYYEYPIRAQGFEGCFNIFFTDDQKTLLEDEWLDESEWDAMVGESEGAV